jgi:putative Mg2+ transporter-C (MgtC) family protein
VDIDIILIRIFLSLVFGAIVGFERQWRRRNAGLRTNALVSLGAALFVLISSNIFDKDASPTRIASQVVTGIGFLGAGVIMKEGLNVRGLNTAATLWCSAAIGSLAGLGFYKEAAFGSLAVVVAHLALRPLGMLIERGPLSSGLSQYTYSVNISCTKKSETSVRAMLVQFIGNTPLQLQALKSYTDPEENQINISATILSAGQNDHILEEISAILSLEKGVRKLSWEIEHAEESD